MGYCDIILFPQFEQPAEHMFILWISTTHWGL